MKWPEVDWNRLRRERRDRVAGVMSAHRLDHVLLTGHDNIRYATDYRSMLICEGFDWFAALVDGSGEATIFLPYVGNVAESPQPDLPWVRRFVPTPSWSPSVTQAAIWIRQLSREIERSGAKRVGVELLTFQLLDGLRRAMPKVEFVSVAEALFEVRQVKTDEEIQLLEASSALNAAASAKVLAKDLDGATDFEILAGAMEHMQSGGAEYITHSVCVTRDTPQSANWFARGKRLRRGDAFFFDVGCYGQGGYGTDICRTAFVGEPPAHVAETYGALLEIYQSAQEMVRPGVCVSRVDGEINRALRKRGLVETPYSMGHGVGLRICESPTIYRPEMMSKDTTLEAGMVIAIEPETTIEVDGDPVVLKVEDTFVVEANGLRRLTGCDY